MNDADASLSLSAKATAQLLGFIPADLEWLRRKRKIVGEPFRERWWQLFPEYRYSERAILDFRASDTDEPFGRVQSSPLVRMANAILIDATENAVSDIHVEPERRNLRIRYRINGTLHEIMAIPKNISTPLLQRYLLMAGTAHPLNLSNAQTGLITIRVLNRNYDLRLSSLPTRYGAKLVMRLVASPAPTRWEELGMSPAQAAQTTDLLQPGVPGLTVFSPAYRA